MDYIRNIIILLCVISLFILLFYYSFSIIHHRRKNTNTIILPEKEPFRTITEKNYHDQSITNTNPDTNPNTNTNDVEEGSSYLKSWFKRSCSCAEGFDTAYLNSIFNFYQYSKISKNNNYDSNTLNRLQNTIIHPQRQTKLYYYNFQYRWKEYMNITNKIHFESGKGATICFWLRIPHYHSNSDGFPFTFLFLSLGNDNYLKMLVNTSGLHLLLKMNNTIYNEVITDLGINNKTWNHIAWTMSPAAENNSDWNIYVNGIHHKTIKNQYYPISSNNNNTLQVIGTDNGVEFFEGDLGDLQIFNHVLNLNDIQTIYNNPTVVETNNSNNAFFQDNINNRANTYNKYKGKTWWGSGALLEASKVVNSQECEIMCNRHPHCSGATYNPDKQYCWAVKGDGRMTPGLNTDYAFIHSSTYNNTSETPVSI